MPNCRATLFPESQSSGNSSRCWSRVRNDWCGVMGEIAATAIPEREIAGISLLQASNCATQNGHQRPRKKNSTAGPLSLSAKSTKTGIGSPIFGRSFETLLAPGGARCEIAGKGASHATRSLFPLRTSGPEWRHLRDRGRGGGDQRFRSDLGAHTAERSPRPERKDRHPDDPRHQHSAL